MKREEKNVLEQYLGIRNLLNSSLFVVSMLFLKTLYFYVTENGNDRPSITEFLAASGWCFGHNFPKCGQNVFKFEPVMQPNLMYQIFNSFYCMLRKWSKLVQKADFLAHFKYFFPFRSLTPRFLHQMKVIIKIYTRGKFHLYSICGSQVVNVQMFSRQSSSHEMALSF